jgi:hypothetical protein
MFLRTAESKLDDAAAGLDLNDDSESDGSGDDSLDNLMLDIAAKGWISTIRELEGDEDDAGTETTGGGEGYTTGGGYTTAGGYTTDGIGSVMEESDNNDDDDDSASGTSSSAEFGQSTAFTTDNDGSDQSSTNTNEDGASTGTSNGPSMTAAEGPLDVFKMDPTSLINPLTFNNTRNVFAKWIGVQESSDADDIESAKGFSKASF